ncbi:MAG TPA: DUF2914 domain-containing protein [Candidatus Paceibacterota bacterium]|jgi:hypothetical protein|nr:DUF2914 domain-containing protein [Candidatus Paceibacterota bacterium]
MAFRDTKIFKWWEKYEHHLGVGALVVGFAFDVILAKRPDSLTDHVLLLTYLTIAGAIIILLNRRQMLKKEQAHSAEPLFLLLLLQFCFGGLASNFLVLYGKSGTFTVDILFLGFLVALVFGNEYLRNRYAQLRFNVGVYYLLILTYCVIAVPVFITHTIGTWVFLLSGLLSLGVTAIFLILLFSIVFRGKETSKLFGVATLVLSIFLVFNILYFLNIIPPVPLSLKDIGVYHSLLKRSDGNYVALYEPSPWWQIWRDTNERYTLGAGESAFCFSSVFAPTNLTVPIYHRWEKYDEADKQWDTQALVTFPIAGGRDQGYRGYSVKSALTPGEWRCDVETERGALIGRSDFTVVNATSTPALSQRTL